MKTTFKTLGKILATIVFLALIAILATACSSNGVTRMHVAPGFTIGDFKAVSEMDIEIIDVQDANMPMKPRNGIMPVRTTVKAGTEIGGFAVQTDKTVDIYQYLLTTTGTPATSTPTMTATVTSSATITGTATPTTTVTPSASATITGTVTPSTTTPTATQTPTPGALGTPSKPQFSEQVIKDILANELKLNPGFDPDSLTKRVDSTISRLNEFVGKSAVRWNASSSDPKVIDFGDGGAYIWMSTNGNQGFTPVDPFVINGDYGIWFTSGKQTLFNSGAAVLVK